MKISEQNIYAQFNRTNQPFNDTSAINPSSAISLQTKTDFSPKNTTLNNGDVAATLETTSHLLQADKKAILYKREQFSAPSTSSVESERIKIRPADYYRNMLRTEAESRIDYNETVSDEQMDLFLRKAFKLFNSPNPFL